MFYGKGGYDFETVYNLPIWLRKFTYHEIVEHYQKEADAVERAGGGQALQNPRQTPDGQVRVPTPPARRTSDISIRGGSK